MKVILTFTKVRETAMQRFYKLSMPIDKVPNPNFNWAQEREWYISRLKPEFKNSLPELIEYVCVSDAHTHIERLVFVAANLGGLSECLGGLQIDGRHTFMIHGGNSRDVHPDEVYLRRIAATNGYTMELKKLDVPCAETDQTKDR